MGDVTVLASDNKVLGLDQFVAPWCQRRARAHQPVVKHAVLRDNTDGNGNEDVHEMPSINEDVGEDEVMKTTGTSKELSGKPQPIVKEPSTQTKENVTSTHPQIPFARDEPNGPKCRFMKDAAQKAADIFGDVLHDVKTAAKFNLRHKQQSIEEPPENNIHLLHPHNQQHISLGLHITEHDEGCRIVRVIKDGIAHGLKLQENDVIMKINGFDLKYQSIGDVISHFAKLNIKERFTLSIRRKVITDHESISFIDIDVHITIILTENKIDFEVEVQVTSQNLMFDHSTTFKQIAQMPAGESPVYMRVNGNHACMDTKTDKKCGSRGRVCVIRNDPTEQVIDESTDESEKELLAVDATAPQRDIISSPDTKFFYWLTIPNGSNANLSAFESLKKNGYYMIRNSDNSLALEWYESINEVPSKGQFEVITMFRDDEKKDVVAGSG